MTRARAGLLLAAVFLAGAVCGIVGATVWVRHHARPGWSGPERMEEVIVRRITRRLDLDAEQRKILERVAFDTGGRIAEVRRHAMERVGEILDRAYDELEPTLRPDQKEKLARMRRKAGRRFGGRPRGAPAGTGLYFAAARTIVSA